MSPWIIVGIAVAVVVVIIALIVRHEMRRPLTPEELAHQRESEEKERLWIDAEAKRRAKEIAEYEYPGGDD